ncbi:PLAC9 protein, partial [Nothoprocta ornata]|nr:PLAC9 protein [Nothoprocta pentlandii]NWX96045.1 PLAC9 protein [Nothoprocta ornata]
AAADPESVLPGGWERAGWCNEQAALSERLDIIEEKVIKTVEYLESEVKSLLESVRETAQDIPVTPETPLGDIFDGKY